jgi:hypothetical protein
MTLNYLSIALIYFLIKDPDTKSSISGPLFSLLVPMLVLLTILANVMLAHPLITRDPNRKRKFLLLTLRFFPGLHIVVYGLMVALAAAVDVYHLALSNIAIIQIALTAWVSLNVSYVLVVAWRLRDLGRTAPALQPTYLQRLLIRHSLITYGLVEFTAIILSLLIKSPPVVTPSLEGYLFFSLFIACRLLLLILAWLQFRRTHAFYHHCKSQWTASLPPKPEPHP